MVSRTQQEDIQEFARTFALANELAKASFLITGATGLIGSLLIRCLLALDKDIRVIAPVRNKGKALAMFDDLFNRVEWVECDLASCDFGQVGKVDYIVHCAAPTSSRFFVDCPSSSNIYFERHTCRPSSVSIGGEKGLYRLMYHDESLWTRDAYHHWADGKHKNYHAYGLLHF